MDPTSEMSSEKVPDNENDGQYGISKIDRGRWRTKSGIGRGAVEDGIAFSINHNCQSTLLSAYAILV